MKTFLAIIFLAFSTTANTETLSFPHFRITLEDGWASAEQPQPGEHQSIEGVTTIHSPDGIGEIRILSLSAEGEVSDETLRNITNLDLSIPLTRQVWGDYSGYQYDYMERDSFFRQWWLVSDADLIFITYSCSADAQDLELDAVNKMVRSIIRD